MDLESLETQTLLNKRTPKHQSFALKLAVLLCGLGLFVGVAVPSTNRGDLQGKATLKEKEVTATAGVSSTSRPASTMSMDWRAAAVVAPAWSVQDTSRTPFGVACRGGGFRQMTMAMGIARGIGAENWPKVTHLGGTSGGYWFASQFTYSKEFYDNVLNESKPLDGVLADWGEDFAHTPRTSSRPSSRLITRTGSSRTSTGRSQRRKPPAPRRSSKLGSRGRSSLRRFPDSGLSI